MSPVVVITIVLVALFSFALSWQRRFSAVETVLVSAGSVLVLVVLALNERHVESYGLKVLLATLGGAAAQYGFDAHRARQPRPDASAVARDPDRR